MPRSSRHKSHKHSKHSRDYTDSEEEVIKTEKRSKDENPIKAHRDAASGEKRKSLSQSREGKDRDLSGHRNGDVLEEHALSKRRKEKFDDIGGDRWSGGAEERGDSDSNVEREIHEGEGLKLVSKLKEYSSKSQNIEVYSSSKSKPYDSGVSGEIKEDGLASMVAAKDESKGKGESRRRSERDSSARKEVEELKEKGHRSDREKNGGQEIKGDGAKGTEKQGKRSRETNDQTLDKLQSPVRDKDVEKKIYRKREGSSERDIHHGDSKDIDERPLPSRSDRAKDVKYRDDKHRDGGYADKYQEDGHKDERRRDEKHKDEVDKYNKYREDGEKDSQRRVDRHRQDGDRDGRRKDEKYHEDGERDSMWRDGKYLDNIEREGRLDDKYHEDADRDKRHKDGRYGEKDVRRVDERYLEDGNRDDRQRDTSRRDDVNRDSTYKEEKYRKGIERDTRHKESKQGDGHDRDKRPRETRYRDELASRDRPGHKSDSKRSRDDANTVDHHSRKSSAYDDSPTHDDRTARYRDDLRKRRKGEKVDFGDIGSQPNKDRRADAEQKNAGNEMMDPVTDKVTSRNADTEPTSSHGRRHSSPTSSVHAARDNYRALKQDEYKYRDCSHDEKYRHNVGGPEKTSSRSLEKLVQRDEDHLHELSAERQLKSDVRASSLEHVDKSSPTSTDRRQFNKADVRNANVDESTHRSNGSRDLREHFTKEGKGCRELAMDVHPGKEDADTPSVSSPFVRNSHFSNSSKSLPPTAPVRTGLDSPSPMALVEDEARGRPSFRYRRTGDPSMGRIQGNSWRGPPNWPSPVANGFLPFPPPIGYHSVMHPFPTPPMFGVRPSMELDHPTPYHMPDADIFSGPGHPRGWCPQINNSGPPLHAWNASNAVFADESHFYGRSDWDHSGIMPAGQGWQELSRWPNKTTGMEMPSSNKDYSLTQSVDDALDGQSLEPTQNEQSRTDQQAENTDLSQWPKNSEKNEVADPIISLGDSVATGKFSGKNDMQLCHVYLSKLDISTDLTEPELFNKCTGLTDVDHRLFSDLDGTNVPHVGDEEAKIASHRLLSTTLFAPTDDSFFLKSMSLYRRQKVKFGGQDGEKLNLFSNVISSVEQERNKVEDAEMEKPYPEDSMQDANDALPNSGTNVDNANNLQKADIAEISKEPISSVANILNPASNLDQLEHSVEVKPLRAGKTDESYYSSFLSELQHATTESVCDDKEAKSVDTSKCGLMLSPPDMLPEAMLAESGSVNLSRIHHSPENTH